MELDVLIPSDQRPELNDLYCSINELTKESIKIMKLLWPDQFMESRIYHKLIMSRGSFDQRLHLFESKVLNTKQQGQLVDHILSELLTHDAYVSGFGFLDDSIVEELLGSEKELSKVRTAFETSLGARRLAVQEKEKKVAFDSTETR